MLPSLMLGSVLKTLPLNVPKQFWSCALSLSQDFRNQPIYLGNQPKRYQECRNLCPLRDAKPSDNLPHQLPLQVQNSTQHSGLTHFYKNYKKAGKALFAEKTVAKVIKTNDS